MLGMQTPAKSNQPNRRISSAHALRTPAPPSTVRRDSISRNPLQNTTNMPHATPMSKSVMKAPAPPNTSNVSSSLSKLKQQDQQNRAKIVELEEKLALEKANRVMEKNDASIQLQILEDRVRELEKKLANKNEELRALTETTTEELENSRCRETVANEKIRQLSEHCLTLSSTLDKYGVNPCTLKSFEYTNETTTKLNTQRKEFEEGLKAVKETYDESKEALLRESHKLDRCVNEFDVIFSELDSMKNIGLFAGIDLEEMERIKKSCQNVIEETNAEHLMLDD